MRIELELCLALNLAPLIFVESAVHNGHDPAVLINTQALKSRAVLYQGPPSALVPHSHLSPVFPELPSHQRADGRFAIVDIDMR